MPVCCVESCTVYFHQLRSVSSTSVQLLCRACTEKAYSKSLSHVGVVLTERDKVEFSRCLQRNEWAVVASIPKRNACALWSSALKLIEE